MAGMIAEQAIRPADWTAALQQIFAEPWRLRPAFQPIVDLGGRVLAVGVEDRAQLDALAAAGITLGQGFGVGRPVPSMAASVTGVAAPLLIR